MATRASSSAVLIGERCCTPSRWLFWSMNPPVPGVDASRKVSGDAHSALPVVLMTWSRYAGLRQPLGIDEDLELPLFWTPDHDAGHPRDAARRGTIVQRARTPSWIGVLLGGEADHHRPARRRPWLEHRRDLGDVSGVWAPFRRSCTTCRAR